jgi:hypothetical protein
VDISDNVVGVSGLQRKYNYDHSLVVPAPEFELYNVELLKGDLLDVRLDDRSIFRLEVSETPVFDYSDGIWKVRTSDLLNRLAKRYAYEIRLSGTSCWWQGLYNPESTEYRFNGAFHDWEEDYIQIPFLLKVVIRYLTGISLDTSAIDDLNSGFVYRHENGYDRAIPFGKLYLQTMQMAFLGVTEPGKRFYETANWLNVVNSLLSILALYLTYDDGQYRLYPAVNDQVVNPDCVYEYSASESEAFDFLTLKTAYVPLEAIYGTTHGGVAWTDDSPVQLEVISLDSATYDDYVTRGKVNTKTVSILSNLALYRIRDYTEKLTVLEGDNDGIVLSGAIDWMTQLATLLAPGYVSGHPIEEISTDLSGYIPTQCASYIFDLRDRQITLQRVVSE